MGLASDQVVGLSYGDFRTALIGTAEDADELALYRSLPAQNVPTDIGNASIMFVPTPVARTIGRLPRIANPDVERLGMPPRIGLNSRFSFDFNRSDGIDRNRLDLEAVIIHEFLHALGFSSIAGLFELEPSSELAMLPLDLYRFRPGTALGAGLELAGFADARRILSSGGNQVFFATGAEVPLSTARPDGSGGDGFQASHWQDNSLAGRNIGIMDPQINFGQLGVLNSTDLKALDVIGYGIGPPPADTRALSIGTAKYTGTTLVNKGRGLLGSDSGGGERNCDSTTSCNKG